MASIYDQFKTAFDYYNEKLFEGALESPLFSIRAKANSAGYFSPERLTKAEKKTKKSVHEIAFNTVILNRDVDRILSTLVHEMVHLWQHQFGAPSRGNYHNKEWSFKMVDVGLIPSATGAPGGAMTGSKMTHYIEEGGIFDKLTRKLMVKEKFNFIYEEPMPKVPRPQSKLKYTCPVCGVNAWGKPELSIDCRPCNAPMEGEE